MRMDVNPSVTGSSAAYPHAVKFYSDEQSLGRTVAEFLAPGLQERQPAIVIATPDHRALIAAELRQRGLNVMQLERDGDLQMVDADTLLHRFMVGDEPDPVAFHATVDELIARACKDRPPCPVRAYGEMVDVLWKRANAAGAPNLIRISVRSDNPGSPGVPSRASAVNSTTDFSANGRFVTSTRWNGPRFFGLRDKQVKPMPEAGR